MAVEGEIIIAEITAVVRQRMMCAPPNGRPGFSPGYVTVSSPWGHLTLVDGSVQGIPEECRVVGKRVKLRWGTAGGYHGPMFAGVAEEDK